MEDKYINQFTKGLNQDNNPINQPEGTYTFAENMVNYSGSGDIFLLTNELGSTNYCTEVGFTIPSGYSIIGRTVLDKDIIVFLFNTVGNNGIVGIISNDNKFTTIIGPTADLRFNIDYPIDCVARTIYNGHRLVYFTDNLNPVGVIDLDNPPVTNIFDNTRLIPFRTMPTVDLVSINETGGNLHCGVYQFAVRYISTSGNTTPFNMVSNIIPIVDENRSVGRTQFDGEYPDITSPKSITIEINNIDTDFSFLEVVAIFYTGNSNTYNAVISHRRPITTTTTTIQVTYDGNEDLGNISIDELTELGISYTSAKALEQKDGRLFISNLSDSKERFELQTIFNDVRVKYQVEEILFYTGSAQETESTNFNDYKEESYTFEKKGYLREEVYSLAIGVVYKDGTRSLAYHIPGFDPNGLGFTNTVTTDALPDTPGTYTGNTEGYCGSYVSTEQYSVGQDYPTVTGNTIRHHKMPSLSQEPHFRYDSGSDTTYIRVLGLKFEFGTPLTSIAGLTDAIQGLYFVRQRRDTEANKSIYCQGIAVNMLRMANNLDSDGETGSLGSVLRKNFWFNNNKMETASEGVSGNDWVKAGTGADLNTTMGQGAIQNTEIAFHSPDINFIDTNIDSTTTLTTPIKLELTPYYTPSFAVELMQWNSAGANRSPHKAPKVWLMGNLDKLATVITGGASRTITSKYKVTAGNYVESTAASSSLDIDNVFGNDFVYLKLDNSLPEVSSELGYKFEDPGTDDTLSLPSTTDFYLRNLTSTNNSQYGSLDAAEYVLIDYKSDTTFTKTDPSLVIDSIFNGDTFITKYAFCFKNVYRMKGYNNNSGIYEYADDKHTDAFINDTGDDYRSADFRTIFRVFLESTTNTVYRHQYTDEISGNTEPIYFPKGSEYDALKEGNIVAGEPKGYNTQYSFGNTLNKFYSKPYIFNNIGRYRVRTIYSEQAIEGETRDAYRDIKVNSFYDLPQNTGEIWDSFVQNNTLYLHTPKCLWKTFVNQISQQATDIGQVVLGTGGLFSIPAQPMIAMGGGYAGTISQWGNTHTPFGYIFVDSLQGKIFKLSGDNLEEISLNGLSKFCSRYIKTYNLTGTGGEYIDNPFKYTGTDITQIGITLGYDPMLKRVLITKVNNQTGFTLSYSFLNQAFISFHTYLPSTYITVDDKLFGVNNAPTQKLIHLFNSANPGDPVLITSTTKVNSILEFVINSYPSSNKVLDTLEIQMDNKNTTNIIVPLRESTTSNDTLQIFNDREYSGKLNLNYTKQLGSDYRRGYCEVRNKRNQYNIRVPKNALVNDTLQFEYLNETLPAGKIGMSRLDDTKVDLNMLYKPRMRGNYLKARLIFKNENNYKLTLNNIIGIFRNSY